jgi:hypothetical protein
MLTTARMSVVPGLARRTLTSTGRRYNAPPNWIAKSYAIRVLEPTGAALSTCTDVLIAGVMLWLLQRSKTGFQRYELPAPRLP